MRRGLALLALCAAFAPATPAAGALQPVQRELGGRTLPRVRTGTIRVPAGHASARVRVIVRLALPPLAAVFGRSATFARAARRLDVRSPASRAYLARLAAAQSRAARALRRAIPSVRLDRRFRLLLDGLTVTLPARRLPQLVRLPFVTRVYPSLAYTQTLDRSPSVIGADTLRAAASATGEGVKIAIVDDGIDQTNPFFSPAGFAYPPGYPLGLVGWTTPKVIVARVFPGPHSGRPGRLPVDPRSSFHGTHVAGIAAGDAGTTAPAGDDHPLVTGLAGVAPRAQLGNYRVFTVPTAVGHVANTPELVAAFEAAVADGMDLINFSGGGAQTEPANDALVEAIRNVAAAGVVPVVAAGNDRNEFGNGSAGSPATAPDAIAVAATSSPHAFAPALTVTSADAPAEVREIPFVAGADAVVPTTWSLRDQQLADVASILGRDGSPVEPHLCGPPGALASTHGQLPPRSLAGAIALVRRGLCPFTTKAAQARAAGAVGIVFVDNREGEANELPLRPSVPAGMISNLDGERLHTYLAAHGGRASVRIGRRPLELLTGRSGVVTSFSSPGPTAFGHALKPDVAAPGGQILSATLPEVARSRFAVFDGTSMATPHVAGAAALLLQLHPTWTPQQVKSALVATAAPAWADSARTREAPVTLAGGGLVDLPRAAATPLFTEPASLSFGDLDSSRDAVSRGLLVRVADAGAGTWEVELAPQAATADAGLDVPGMLFVPPDGEAALPVVARAAAGAPAGENYGFLVLRRGAETLRIPYLFLVAHPRLAALQAFPLARLQSGDTSLGASYTETYRYPQAPFGNAPDTPPMVEDGAEQLYVLNLNEAAANVGVAVVASSPGARIDPFVLGTKDENDVQGFAGTPIDVNVLTVDYLLPIGAAGAAFPRQQAFYVAVDSGRDPFTGRRLAGRYVLRSWVNDVTPPRVRVLTRRVSAGRPTLALRVRDAGAGVDPFSLVLGVRSSLVGASAYDPETGLALFPLSRGVDSLRPGRLRVLARASDFQEAKNVNTSGPNPMPNTRFLPATIRVVDGPALTWLTPTGGTCVRRRARLLAIASSTRPLRRVLFLADGRRIGIDRRGARGLYSTAWRPRRSARGRHRLEAVAVDAAGRAATARRIVRACR